MTDTNDNAVMLAEASIHVASIAVPEAWILASARMTTELVTPESLNSEIGY